MKNIRLGICKLCDIQSNLVKSHVIPRSVFAKTLKGYTYGRVLDRKYNKVVNEQDQWSTRLLCSKCEHMLNVNYEQYSLKILRTTSSNMEKLKKNDLLHVSDVDQKVLILFIISILWRAIESEHEIFKNLKIIQIDSTLKQLLKHCVRDNWLPFNNFFSVKISKLITKIDIYKNIKLDFISNFSIEPHENERIRILFIIEGYFFEIYLHTNPYDLLLDTGVLNKKKKILKIPLVEIFSIPCVQEYFTEILQAKT
ncbi:hypothetical protein OK024_01385 [Acinetobacter sp. UGAL515B_02]|nr:hypothetical protein [Acinetobacter sp. UGAL515B_02]WON80526.1 hypothetical protein OK024_01385 [Acinetobacter sp. UGAL515B_02]